MMNSRRSSHGQLHKDDWLEPLDEDEDASCDLCVLNAHERRLQSEQQQQQTGSPERRESRVTKRIPQVTIAAMQGRLEHVRHWIEHAACDVDTMDFMGTMPLHRAALEGHVRVVEYLITRGAALQTRVLDVKDTVLHLAAARGHAPVITALLNAGAHIEARNADNYTPLLAAIRSNQLAAVQALIARGASVSAPWAVDAHDIGTGLHLAVQCGHLALTKFLLGVVALDVNQKTRRRKATLLHFAALHGHVEVTQYLVERHHADVRARDARGMTPLHYACDYEYHLTMPIEQHGTIEMRHVEIVTCLFKAGAQVKPRRLRDHATPLRCAARRGHFQLAKTLLDHGARSNKATQWLFALLWAARDPHKLKLLLSSEGNDPSKPSTNQSSRKQSSLSSSADPTKRSTSRDSMSSCGTLPDSPIAMTMLLENGSATSGYASVTNRLGGGSHCTALHRACLDSDLTLLLGILGRIQQQQLSSTTGTRENDDGVQEHDTLEARLLPEGFTALHLACRNGWLRGVAALVKCGADLNAQTTLNDSTPLHLAAEQGHLAVIKQLVAHGAKVNACTSASVTPLLVALRNGRSGAIKYLLRHGASSRASISGCGSSTGMSLGDFVVVSAPPAEDEDELDDLSKQEDDEALVRVFNPKRTTVLHMAAFYGRVDIVRQLVCEGEDVEARDQDGATPVWLAALVGHLDVVECLAEHGANLNAVAKSGASVALGAAEFGHLEVLAFLTAPTPALSFERLSLTRLSLQDHGIDERTSLTSLTM